MKKIFSSKSVFFFYDLSFLKQDLIHDFIGIRMIICIQQNPDPQHCNKYVLLP